MHSYRNSSNCLGLSSSDVVKFVSASISKIPAKHLRGFKHWLSLYSERLGKLSMLERPVQKIVLLLEAS